MRFLQEKLYKRHLPRIAADEYKIVSLDMGIFKLWKFFEPIPLSDFFGGVLVFGSRPQKIRKNKWKKSWKKKTKGGRWFNFTFPSPRFPPILFPRLSIRVINNWIFFSSFPVVVVVSVRQFSMPFRGRAEEEEERREAFRLGSHGVSHNHDTRTHRKKQNKQNKRHWTLATIDDRPQIDKPNSSLLLPVLCLCI
jgi:hypothetical protein